MHWETSNNVYLQSQKGNMKRTNNNITAFDSLYKEYYLLLVNYAHKFVKDGATSEDLVQDLFIEVWNKKDDLDMEAISIKFYLFRAIKNRIINHIQRKKNELSITSEDEKADNLIAEALLVEPPLNSLLYKDVKEAIRTCVDTLPEKCKEVFKYSRVMNRKNKEIAEELNISEKTVEKHITSALKQIREYL